MTKTSNKKPAEIIIEQLSKSQVVNRKYLEKIKRKTAKQTKASLLSNIILLQTYHRLLKSKKIKKSKAIEAILITRPVRSISGIVNVSVLTKPYPCPGKCVFCPTQKGFPKSYLGGEPAADRAKALNFNPYLQVQKRLEMLEAQGHPIDKIELRVVGGTWSAYPKAYQTWFIKNCFSAANDFNVEQKPKHSKLQDLQKLTKTNEKAKNKIVGLSIETRPDFITKKEILRLRTLGVTLVEMGVQTIFDDILKKSDTGLTIKQIANATHLLKDAGFKVLYQIMPNLPGADIKKDIKMFEILFQDIRFKPDWLKIYPCLVCPGAKLVKLWQEKKYQPYSKEKLIKLLIKVKQDLPYWVRLTRVFRDIPSQSIIAGCRTSNLRELVVQELEKQKKECHCIRCREVKGDYDPQEKIFLFREDFQSSNGTEVFLSFENKKRTKLYSLLKLRIPKNTFLPALKNASIIRELQTFGRQLEIKKQRQSSAYSPQHKGMGKKLVRQAEEITTKDFQLKKIAVISGVGARGYYRKLGYRLKDTYMLKNL